MEQSKWYDALKEALKAKDKSIYNFIQWKHLLTTGNKAHLMNIITLLIKILIIQELIELNIWQNISSLLTKFHTINN